MAKTNTATKRKAGVKKKSAAVKAPAKKKTAAKKPGIVKPIRLSVFSGSRLPVLGRDYSASTHRYTRDYVFPRSYSVFVDANPGEDVIRIINDPEPPQGGGPPIPIKLLRLKVPGDTVAVSFAITEVKGRFSKTVTRKIPSLTRSSKLKPPFALFHWNVAVPRLGAYEVTVKMVNRRGGGPSNRKQISLSNSYIVSIGDSAASGQGNPDVPGAPEGFEPNLSWWDVFNPAHLTYELTRAAIDRMSNYIKQKFTTLTRLTGGTIDMDPDPVWLEKKAYRSLRSGPALAARRMENSLTGRMITFLSFARSGSEIQNGLLKSRTKNGKPIDDWVGNIGQVQEVINTVGTQRIEALIISIGVNDIGVSGVLSDLVAHDFGADDAQAREKIKQRALLQMAKIPANLSLLAERLQKLNIRDIYLTEYPIGLFDRAGGLAGAGCGIFTSSILELDFTVDDTRLIKELAESLNALLQEEAKKRGWFYITGIASRFAGRGYCTSDDIRCFIQAEESLIIQGDTEGTIHPNARGHKMYAEQIAAAVKQNTLEKVDLEILNEEPAAPLPGPVVVA